METEILIDEIPLDPGIQVKLAEFDQHVKELEQKSHEITVTDDVGEGAAVIFIAGIKQVSKDLDDYRDGLVRPHNTFVRKVNDSVRNISTLASQLVSAMDGRRSQYLLEKQRQIEEANRKAAAEAERIRAEKERKEREQREAAERARQEAERLETERIEREIKAEMEKQEAERKRREAEAAIEAARLKAIADAEAAQRAIREGHVREAEKAKRLAEESKRAEEEARQKAEQAKAEEAARIQKEEEDRKASLAAQAKLESQANRLEVKADLVASEASVVSPEIQFNTLSTVRTLASGAKVSTRTVQEVTCWENGTPVYKDPIKRKYDEFMRTDKCIPEELKKPEFDKYWVFDIAAAVRDVKGNHIVPGLSAREAKKTVGGKRA